MRHLPEWIIESHGVHDIGVLVEREQLLAGVRVPNFAGAIITSSDELASVLVEGTVGQGKQVRAQNFEQAKALGLVLLLLLDKLFDEFLELGLFGLRNEWLFEQDLVDQAINVRPKKVESFSKLLFFASDGASQKAKSSA